MDNFKSSIKTHVGIRYIPWHSEAKKQNLEFMCKGEILTFSLFIW
jgi:hypothetical protein